MSCEERPRVTTGELTSLCGFGLMWRHSSTIVSCVMLVAMVYDGNQLVYDGNLDGRCVCTSMVMVGKRGILKAVVFVRA